MNHAGGRIHMFPIGVLFSLTLSVTTTPAASRKQVKPTYDKTIAARLKQNPYQIWTPISGSIPMEPGGRNIYRAIKDHNQRVKSEGVALKERLAGLKTEQARLLKAKARLVRSTRSSH